jgi:hypothetical protein
MSFRVAKKVISMSTHDALLCCWDDCTRPGYDMHQVRVNDAAAGCEPRIVKFVFCSEGHRQYFIDENPVVRGDSNTAELHGRLRSGNRSSGRYV